MTSNTNAGPPDRRIDMLLDFWFEGHPADSGRMQSLKKKWFSAAPADDHALAQSFGELARGAARGDLDFWADTPRGRLALIILLDQLPRSLHRHTAAAFAQDDRALALCLDGLEHGLDEALHPLERVFFCMPLQHAESRDIQALGVETFRKLAAADMEETVAGIVQNAADFAVLHKDIVDRFGRFPHRNKVLGRESTAEELEFLAAGGSSFGQ